jgi:hypothetical protein
MPFDGDAIQAAADATLADVLAVVEREFLEG